jgi:polysaccharide deacetylase 2 family uncharacterized protein YibQ
MFVLAKYKKHVQWTCFLLFISGVSVLLSFTSVMAKPTEDATQAIISIIIDDLGYRLKEGKTVINLAGPLTYAAIPHAPHTHALANLANQQGKEVMVHLPMQAEVETPTEKGALMLDMTHAEFIKVLNSNVQAVPHAVGINNHQGSLLTRHPGHMAWVMAEIKKSGDLYFIDSRTSKQSVAEKVAREYFVPTLHRDVFLDHDKQIKSIRTQFMQLVRVAKRRGSAIGIGHPYPETIKVLREMLPKLEELGVRLVPVSAQFETKPLKKQLAVVSTY